MTRALLALHIPLLSFVDFLLDDTPSHWRSALRCRCSRSLAHAVLFTFFPSFFFLLFFFYFLPCMRPCGLSVTGKRANCTLTYKYMLDMFWPRVCLLANWIDFLIFSLSSRLKWDFCYGKQSNWGWKEKKNKNEKERNERLKKYICDLLR